jgi:uncharacterized protein YoxC
MAMMCLAMWLQESDPAGNRRLIVIAVGLIAVAIAVITVIMLVIAVKVSRAIKDLLATADEVRGKVMPLLDEALEISRTSRTMLQDAAPKVKVITDNLTTASATLAETSKAARSAVAQFDTTIVDVNMRTQRQVARVDGMLTAALTSTAELAEAIGNGIRVPAQKIAVAVTQARYVAEGLLAKIRSMASGSE